MTDSSPIPDAIEGVRALSSFDLSVVEAGRERGIAEYGSLSLSGDAFARRVAALAALHWRGQGAEPTPARISEYVAGAAIHDLFLASACDAGDPAAWETLSRCFRRRLEGFAVRRGVGSAQAESFVQDLIGDLASPPPKAASRTLLGMFDGSGSLFGWLCTVLFRRIAARARGALQRSLASRDVTEQEAEISAAAAGATVDPADAAVRAETAARFTTALATAWKGLTAQERLALVSKHRDSLTQRRVCDLLGLGEARVSRIVAAGVRKLSDALSPVVGGAIGRDLWRRLEAAVATHLASLGSVAAPTMGATARFASGDAGSGRFGPG